MCALRIWFTLSDIICQITSLFETVVLSLNGSLTLWALNLDDWWISLLMLKIWKTKQTTRFQVNCPIGWTNSVFDVELRNSESESYEKRQTQRCISIGHCPTLKSNRLISSSLNEQALLAKQPRVSQLSESIRQMKHLKCFNYNWFGFN